MATHSFRTLEVSNPLFERDNLRCITVKSTNLGGRGDILVYVPIDCPKDVAVVVLLHGVYGSAWSWPLSSGVHLQAEAAIRQGTLAPMMLVMPSDGLWGDGSGYVPHASADFERWIVDDVQGAVRQVFSAVVSPASPFFIAGLSMGGYGAIRIGVKYPDVFSGFSGLSSITALHQLSLFVEEPLDVYRPLPDEGDLIQLIRKYRVNLRPFRFDCGRSDPLFASNREFERQLLEEGVPYRFFEYDGGHEWPYWQRHIMETLRFFDAIARDGPRCR